MQSKTTDAILSAIEENKKIDEENVAVQDTNAKNIAPEVLVLDHPSYKELAAKLTDVENKAQEYWNKFLRLQADLANLQRRSEREIANAHKYSLEKFAYELLAVVDNLERSLAAKISDQAELKDFYIGIELTLKALLDVLHKHGITPINPVQELFNPEQHTAMMIREDPNAKSHTVLEVVQKGYWLKDRLLRPALVVVAK